MNIRRILAGLRRNWNRPFFWEKQFQRRVMSRYHLLVHGNDGHYVLDEDWDNLVILDACRYDLFEEFRTERGVKGKLEKRISRGSTSEEFLRENFGGEHHDIVYVTANPFVERVLDDPFHHVGHVWKDGWDDDAETVLPETTANQATAAHDQFPNKRLVVHFMQPHNPFIGDVSVDAKGFGPLRSKTLGESGPDESKRDVWERLRDGDISESKVREAYRSNLERAWPAVEHVVDGFTGKTVVTADHGNVFGIRASPFPIHLYGHNAGLRVPGLIEVPWFVLPFEERKSVAAHPSGTESEATDDAVVKQRLESLGYHS